MLMGMAVRLHFLLLAGMIATSIIQPMDMIKVRIQLAGEGARSKAASPFAVAANLIKNEGLFSLYKGLSGGLLRPVSTQQFVPCRWCRYAFGRNGAVVSLLSG